MADDLSDIPRPGGIVPSADIWDDDLDDDDTDTGAVVVPLDPLYDGRTDEAAASRMARWARESAVGAGLAGFGRGIQQVIDPRDPVELVSYDQRDPDDPDEPVSVKLHRDQPDRSVATLRPWLLDDDEPTSGA